MVTYIKKKMITRMIAMRSARVSSTPTISPTTLPLLLLLPLLSSGSSAIGIPVTVIVPIDVAIYAEKHSKYQVSIKLYMTPKLYMHYFACRSSSLFLKSFFLSLWAQYPFYFVLFFYSLAKIYTAVAYYFMQLFIDACYIIKRWCIYLCRFPQKKI